MAGPELTPGRWVLAMIGAIAVGWVAQLVKPAPTPPPTTVSPPQPRLRSMVTKPPKMPKVPLPPGAWHDPSISPQQLEEAYPRLAHRLPVSELPKKSPIHPPDDILRDLERKARRGELVIE